MVPAMLNSHETANLVVCLGVDIFNCMTWMTKLVQRAYLSFTNIIPTFHSLNYETDKFFADHASH